LGWFWAIHKSGCDSDAGRGGAIADVIALGSVLLTRGDAATLYNLLSKKKTRATTGAAKPIDIESTKILLQQEISTLLVLLDRDAEEQQIQNWCLAIGTTIGTLVWGFGDYFAHVWMASHHHPTCRW
jgi:uncharacterized protein YcfJ